MTYRILSNKKNKGATILFTANTTLVVAGAVGVSNIAIGDEVLTGAQIDSVIHGCPDLVYARVLRGANTAFVVNTTGFVDFSGNGSALNIDPGATLVVEFNGSEPGTLILNVKKIGRGSSDY
jgi:hypothetical protein